MSIDICLMKMKARLILIHIAGCLLFLMLPLLFAPDALESLNILKSQPTQRNLVAYLLMIGFFYFNFFLLIPRLYFAKKYRSYFVAALLCFIVVVIVPTLLFPERPANHLPPPFRGMPNQRMAASPGAHTPLYAPPPQRDGFGPSRQNGRFPPPAEPRRFSFFSIAQHLFIFLAVAFFSLILRISNRWKQTEKEKINAELLYLRSQVNPHFLFNTLNNIYALALDKSDHTADAVVKLSGMMRYVLTDSHQDFVSLEKEIVYIRNYIELQEMRFENSIDLSFKIEGSTAGKTIAPLILLAFIENAFKHGINAEEDSSIRIKIDILERELNMLVRNNKVTSQQTAAHSGLGIENTRNRLKLLYPAKHTLMIKENEKNFTVSLNLQLS